MTGAFVVDASSLVAAVLPDERGDDVLPIFERTASGSGCAPGHWPLEIASAFLRAERRRRIDRAFRDAAIARLLALPVTLVPLSSADVAGPVARLAITHALTIYDAAYLRLARDEGLPLATRDRDLARAAAAEGVAVI